MTRQFELVETVKGFHPSADEELINRAYVFSMQAHGKQKRASGEPYFTHPMAVAKILADLHMDAVTVSVGLLHDTVEDTLTTVEELKTIFGEEIANLVQSVTKLTELESKSHDSQQIENLRRLFVAMANDIRVLIVKLADRLHNMRTLEFVKPEKRKRIAQETLDIFAPLAERIGMRLLKDELEDLAFTHLHPQSYTQLTQRLSDFQQRNERPIQQTIQEIEQHLKDEGIEAKVLGRLKTPYAIWRKMQTKDKTLDHIKDLVGFRILVSSLETCYRVLGLIHHEYYVIPGRFKDYISTPKANGYQSLHTAIIGPHKEPIEIQIRTFEMDSVSGDGLAAHWNYKDGKKSRHPHHYTWLKKLLASLSDIDETDRLLEHAKIAFFDEEVLCFTPKGEVIALPAGSSVLDFAFAIHSEMGLYAASALIDGEPAPLSKTLTHGNQVKIITQTEPVITDNALRFCKTSHAINRIKRFIKQQKLAQLKSLGKKLLDKQLKRRQITQPDWQKILKHFNVPHHDHVYQFIAQGKVGVRDVADLIENNLINSPTSDASPCEEVVESPNAPYNASLHELPIVGLSGTLLANLSRCCCPIPGDPITGLVHERTMKIHRTSCKNVLILPQKQMVLEWIPGQHTDKEYDCRMRVNLYNNKGNLAEFFTLTAQQNASINNIRILKRNPKFWEMIVDLGVFGLDHLLTIIAVLKTQSFMTKVERV